MKTKECETFEEYKQEINNLSKYHDCEKCHGKIVVISADKLGNTYCGYCGEKVEYPRMSKEAFEKYIKEFKEK